MTVLSSLGTHLRANVVGYLALVIATSGTAYAVPTALAKNSVRSPQIVNGQVRSADLGANAVTGAKVKDGTLTGLDLQDGSVAGADVKDGGLTAADLADGSVGAAELATGAVGTDEVADGTLTGDDVADGSLSLGDLGTISSMQLSTNLKVGGYYCPNTNLYAGALTLNAQVGNYCAQAFHASTVAGTFGSSIQMRPITGTYPFNVGAETGVLYFEEDTSTNPDTIRLKIKWPNDTTTTLATGTDEDND